MYEPRNKFATASHYALCILKAITLAPSFILFQCLTEPSRYENTLWDIKNCINIDIVGGRRYTASDIEEYKSLLDKIESYSEPSPSFRKSMRAYGRCESLQEVSSAVGLELFRLSPWRFACPVSYEYTFGLMLLSTAMYKYLRPPNITITQLVKKTTLAHPIPTTIIYALNGFNLGMLSGRYVDPAEPEDWLKSSN